MIAYDLTKLPAKCTCSTTHTFDGDTVRVAGVSYVGIVRIFGIDAPEVGQDYFLEARNLLIALTRNQSLTITPMTWDIHGRLVATIESRSLEDIGFEMIHRGAAWHEPIHSPEALEYKEAQQTARKARLGLWGMPPPHVPPWFFRQHHRPYTPKRKEPRS